MIHIIAGVPPLLCERVGEVFCSRIPGAHMIFKPDSDTMELIREIDLQPTSLNEDRKMLNLMGLEEVDF